MSGRTGRTTAIRGTFVAYLVALTIGTHWPKLQIEGPVERPDLWIHFAAYGGLCVLGAASAWFGPALSRRNVLATAAITGVWSVVDEVTQGIPVLHRHVSLLDALANLGGVALATGALLVLGSAKPAGGSSR